MSQLQLRVSRYTVQLRLGGSTLFDNSASAVSQVWGHKGTGFLYTAAAEFSKKGCTSQHWWYIKISLPKFRKLEKAVAVSVISSGVAEENSEKSSGKLMNKKSARSLPA